MKKIEATIKPFRLDEVREALGTLGVEGMNVQEVKGFDPQARANWYRGTEYVVSFAPQIKLEVVVPDDQLARCVAAIRRCAADEADSGQIIVLSVDDSIQIRTGEHLARAA